MRSYHVYAVIIRAKNRGGCQARPYRKGLAGSADRRFVRVKVEFSIRQPR